MRKTTAKSKRPHLSKASVATAVLATIFVIAYVFTISYTYGNLFETARRTVLKSTVSSAASFSKIVVSDVAQMDYIDNELSSKFEEYSTLSSEEYERSINEFLKSSTPGGCEMLSFFLPDGSYYSSNGQTGKLSSMELFKNIVAEKVAFVTNVTDKMGHEYAFFCRPITKGQTTYGYLVGTYNYNEVLNATYPDELYDEQSQNFILTSDGKVFLSSTYDGAPSIDEDNFFKFIEDTKDKNDASDSYKAGDVEAVSNTIIVDGKKYVVAYAPLNDFPELYIARIIPSQTLFSQTGNLLAFLTIASLCFFFAVTLIAYRYYKSLSNTSAKVQNVALTDPLTGFANFAKFKEDAEELLRNCGSEEYYICCADIVGFRYINDAFGYDTGDKILIAITHEIDDLLLEDEIFARISGDKFVILTKRNFSDTDTTMFIYQLTDRISTIQPLAKSHIRLEIHMGTYKINPGDIDHMSLNALYDRCLVALYSIEHADTGVASYDASIHNEQIAKKEIESKMHQALKDGEFRVYVQPKYRTSNGKLAAGEALIRWIDPEKGIVPPIKFIPLFEQNRFVHNVDLYVMEVVSRFLRMRLNDGLPVVPISLNISPVEISMPNFRESYISIKDKYDIPDKLIELEFTEGIFFENEELFKEVILDFQKHGFTCSMDDFGSGYSSLNILKDIPVDTLKLDKLFFRESENTARDRSIIRSVVAMARSLNIKTVAEGVETLDVVDFLKLIGCTLIQGYIYSKPLPLTEFEERLDTENIDNEDSPELDFDKFELVPLDMPLTNSLDSSLRRTYAAIVEINTGGNIYHIYYPGESNVRFDKIPERGFFTAFLEDLLPKYVHPEDAENARKQLNPISLSKHFAKNSELDFEYRHMKKDGTYSWMKIHIIKASGGRTDSQIYFAYFNTIDDYKEAEENLEALKGRFTAAYSKLNGAVFELTLADGNVNLLESHSNILGAVKDVKDYSMMVQFILENLLHPDYIEKLTTVCSLEYLRKFFIDDNNTQTLSVEVLAKPSRKVTSYNYYIATFTNQEGKGKVLLTIEDATARKSEEIAASVRNKITDIAFASTFEGVTRIYLNRDLYQATIYSNNSFKNVKTTEGKYSLHWENTLETLIKETDRETLNQILSLEGLANFYNDKDTNQFRMSFQQKRSESSTTYEWKELLVVAVPNDFIQDEVVYLFKRSINEERETEQSLNEYAHRLSYSLAMFDYAYSVDCNTEQVEIIGGLKFDSEIFNEDEISYSKVTLMVKNSTISEEDQSAFRRFTYLDELQAFFSTHPAMVTRYFRASEDSIDKFVEVSVIYGAREQKITIFVRTLDKSLLGDKRFWYDDSNDNQYDESHYEDPVERIIEAADESENNPESSESFESPTSNPTGNPIKAIKAGLDSSILGQVIDNLTSQED